ncbi:uncharacterized protein LOC118341048 [Morone saxatilis]|uniref:uncharacterized protein LOC118341048 n=1 Tax=Morone saxatilis TaxID=34816 RepID=UPI0015E20DC2|nr:uncharacterized protein LOC118341048 [Morone saxatilis]
MLTERQSRMAVFRWIEIPLFLMLLHLKAMIGQYSAFTVRDGDEVTLTCENVIQDQDECNRTTWLFTFFAVAQVELVRLGQIGEQAKDKSDRLSVSENCSLVIKNVTIEDVGLYICRQVESERHGDTYLHLFVINMTEHKDNDEVMLSCSVSRFGSCRHTVNWLYKSERVDEDNKDMKISKSECSATVTFLTSYLKHQPSGYHKSFKCEAHDHYTGKMCLFPFSPQFSGEDPTTSVLTEAPTTTPSTTTSTTASTTTSTKQEACTDWSVLNYIMLVMRVAELLLITVITVLLIRARGNQRPPDDSTVHRDEDGHDGTVNYENVNVNVKTPSASVRLDNFHC